MQYRVEVLENVSGGRWETVVGDVEDYPPD